MTHARWVVGLVLLAGVATAAYAAYLSTHLEGLVFRASGEYRYSDVLRGLGTWGVAPMLLAWLLLVVAVRRNEFAGFVRVVAWATAITLPFLVALNAVPYSGVLD